MTELEYKEQSERMKRYKNAQDRISVIEKKKSAIQNGLSSMNCAYDKRIEFDYLGEDFKQRLVDFIVSFLDTEVETIRKSMGDI